MVSYKDGIWFAPIISDWFVSRKFRVEPLNLNILIPFKDNKGQRRNLYRKEIVRYSERLDGRVVELRLELVELFGPDFALNITARSDGNSKKYYWRFKSSKRDRKFNRLGASAVLDYLKAYDEQRRLRVKEIEEELIYINGNLKLVKGMLDAIDQVEDELDVNAGIAV